MQIFYEEEHAQNLLNGINYKGHSKQRDFNILAKYYKSLGYSQNKIKDSLIKFGYDVIPSFNEVTSYRMINKAIRISEKNDLSVRHDVFVTDAELESIKSIKNYKHEKILFTMLVVSKFFNSSTSEKISYYCNLKFGEILRLSKVSATGIERKNMGYDINNYGLVKYHVKEGKDAKDFYWIFFVDNNSPVKIVVNDLYNVSSFYPFFCTVCGKEYPKTGRNQTMCDECWGNKKKELDREYIRTHYKKKLS
jgi:hypothetical protein